MPKNLQKFIRLPASRVPVVAYGDVVVVGGGNAGFIAAVASARAGAKTILVEGYGYLAGSLSGTYATTPSSFGDSEYRQIIRGIAGNSLNAWSKQVMPRSTGTCGWCRCFRKSVRNRHGYGHEAGVELYLHSWRVMCSWKTQ